jgi:hypothetical protein
MMGLMAGGYYFHNISIPILKNAKDRSKNVRNVFIGFFLAFLSYMACGIMGYIGYIGSYFGNSPPIE